MKIQIIDFGAKCLPKRAHDNDAGADVYARQPYIIGPQQTVKIPLGFGLKLPDGYAGYIFPRSGLSATGIVCELPPIDSGYRGEVHAIVTNYGKKAYTVCEDERIGQLVIMPVVIPEFVKSSGSKRGTNAFGSTGR